METTQTGLLKLENGSRLTLASRRQVQPPARVSPVMRASRVFKVQLDLMAHKVKRVPRVKSVLQELKEIQVIKAVKEFKERKVNKDQSEVKALKDLLEMPDLKAALVNKDQLVVLVLLEPAEP